MISSLVNSSTNFLACCSFNYFYKNCSATFWASSSGNSSNNSTTCSIASGVGSYSAIFSVNSSSISDGDSGL